VIELWRGNRRLRVAVVCLVLAVIAILAIAWYASLWTVPRIGIPPAST
jgi:hypothetical protein